MATRLGAAAAQLGGVTGQLKEGLQADLIQLSVTDKTRHLPLYDIESHLVYVLDSSDVVTTVVAGKVLMEERKVLTIDESALRSKVKARSDEIRAALLAQQKSAAL